MRNKCQKEMSNVQQQEIHKFLERYFTANECEIIERHEAFMNVQLTVELDKQLMNRPFYWHYLEKTNGVPNPMQLTVITDQKRAPDDLKGDVVHFGAPRLHQIFESTRSLGGYIRLYQDVSVQTPGNVPLHPWLGLNVKVSYQCDKKKDLLLSLGLHLISGSIIENFQETMGSISLKAKIPDYCFTMSPLIKPQSGLNRIKQYITNIVEADDHEWADKARERWDEDLELLNHFYEGLDEMPESYETEKEALKQQYEPKVKVEIINGGLFYLHQDMFRG